jgi:hypothetical protein
VCCNKALTALTKPGCLIDAMGYQSLVYDDPTFDFRDVVAWMFVNRGVKDPGIIGAHAGSEEVKGT